MLILVLQMVPNLQLKKVKIILYWTLMDQLLLLNLSLESLKRLKLLSRFIITFLVMQQIP